MNKITTMEEVQKRIINLEVTQEIIVNALVHAGIIKIETTDEERGIIKDCLNKGKGGLEK